jgi:hypothetical protein
MLQGAGLRLVSERGVFLEILVQRETAQLALELRLGLTLALLVVMVVAGFRSLGVRRRAKLVFENVAHKLMIELFL